MSGNSYANGQANDMIAALRLLQEQGAGASLDEEVRDALTARGLAIAGADGVRISLAGISAVSACDRGHAPLEAIVAYGQRPHTESATALERAKGNADRVRNALGEFDRFRGLGRLEDAKSKMMIAEHEARALLDEITAIRSSGVA